MRPAFTQLLSRAHTWAAITVTESYLRTPHALKKLLDRRNLHAPHENVSTVLWLSGLQTYLERLDDELSLAAGLLFLAAGVLGTWVGRRLFA
ncbi:MAG TPA: hypothetical protein VMH36_16675 [Alphaproteobacteria bacterium]|nr:hypothetical protein [Alphaproteobacteria bacterium]